MLKRLFHFYPFLALVCVTLFISSCSFSSNNASGTSQVSAQAVSTPVAATPTPIPPVSTNCPAAGTAQAAIMPPLPAGSHQGVLYITSKSSGSSYTNILSRYDVTTGQKTDLLTMTGNVAPPLSYHGTIVEARLSNNGQWIAFVTVAEGKQAVQLVRADGQELQTLYCTTSVRGNYLSSVLSFSPDAKYLTFEESPADSSGHLNLLLLELATGKLYTLEKLDNPQLAAYEPLKWRDNVSLYANYSLQGVGDTRNRHKVYLIPDVIQNSTPQQISLPKIPGGSNDTAYDFDFSPDNAQFLASDCQYDPGTEDRYTSPCTIEIAPVTGGTPHIIHTSQHIMTYARFITNTTIWFSLYDSSNTSSNGLWKMNIDGSGLTRLAAGHVNFEELSYSSSMHLSPDNTMFAIQGDSILIGSINGGNTTTIGSASSSASLTNLVGWTTF